MFKNCLMSKGGLLLGAFLLGSLPFSGALAREEQEGASNKQIRIAAQHARYAAQADGASGVHRHLQHTINCLVGKSGEGFDVSAGNPCHGKGNGALQDFQGDSATLRLLQQAHDLASTGVEVESHATSHWVAQAVAALLMEAEEVSSGEKQR